MSSSCSLHNITDFWTVDYDSDRVASGLFYADGCLCMIFALLTHFQYSSVTVLNYSVNTRVTSNARWIWFFILSALSSIMNGLNFWLNSSTDSTNVPFIVGWIAHLFAVLLLAFAIKYQWKYREEAYQDMSSENETTPILFPQTARMYLSPADYLLSAFFVIACVFFIIGLAKENDVFYWISFGFSWSIRIAIFIIMFLIHYKISEEGPSIFIKCVLLAGVFLNMPSDIPAYIWIKCALHSVNVHQKEQFYDTFIGLVILSHIAFFIVLRSEFLRLRDITRWHIANNIDGLEKEQPA